MNVLRFGPCDPGPSSPTLRTPLATLAPSILPSPPPPEPPPRTDLVASRQSSLVVRRGRAAGRGGHELI